MNNQFSSLLQNLVSIAPRRGKGEKKACDLILRYLDDNNIKYEKQTFVTRIPVVEEAHLSADEKEIPCVGASFASGEFNHETPILNAIGATSEKPAIIFNPISKGVCLQSYKTFPSVSVNRDSIVQLVIAKTISGSIKVSEESFKPRNILAGNVENPQNVVFAHYDSIVGAGAIDNAGSVDVLIQTIKENQGLLKEHLFVFVGSEEESLSSHEGGYGFEVFDKKYKKQLDNAEKIIILDGIGIGNPLLASSHVDWVFPIVRVEELSKKILWMQNDQTLVMQYYHSELDTLDKLAPRYLKEAQDLLLEQLK